ncbi:lipase [Vibrio lentus]|uniref:alpha/beta fold hydrolase n=1 Tax=Vibrio lentus TaxID=136468 RepID=UPI000C81F8C6|nr:alpha/beta fold hydrolase [Vibrio lentus]PML48316.1 lipase [Vibrio lentus]PMN25233.1 lipase [Vibrio lentus]
MTTPVKCESYEGEILKEFNKPYLCGLITLALLGCQSEDSTQEPVSVLVPYNINELPKPNDGYGYDDDGTITGVGEDVAAMSSTNDAYYQDYNNSYAALDGWGLCAEPILIPLQSVNSDKRYPLDNNSLLNNVVLIDESGELVETKIEADGENIKIQCESSLKSNSTYSVVVTDGVKTEFGESLQAADSFNDLLYSGVPLKNEGDSELQKQVLNAVDSYYKQFPDQGIPVYAAQFTTQSAYSTLDAMRDNHSPITTGFIGNLKTVKTTDSYILYRKNLKLPFYLPFTFDRQSECELNEFEPKRFCPPLYEWMESIGGQFLTGDYPLPEVTDKILVVSDIYMPVRPRPLTSDGVPTIIFVHGVTADKSAASLMAKEYTDKGYAVVAIDMPYHGLRVRHDKNRNEIGAKANKAHFINIDSPLALRSNLQQTVSDFLGLRYALNSEQWVDQENIHLVGHSLGGIISVMISEFSQPETEFAFKTVNFVVPGQGLTNLVLSSQTLGPEMSDGVKDSPDVQRGIAEIVIPETCTTKESNQTCIEALDDYVKSSENALIVEQLEDDIYSLLVTDIKQGVQTAIDSSDPASFTDRQRLRGQPTLLLAAVGDCGSQCDVGVDYIPDSVVPNSAQDNIRTGTEPLIDALGLNSITGSSSVLDSRGVLRTTTGGHGTYLFPYEGTMGENGLPSMPDTAAELKEVADATTTQQIAVASMVVTRGNAVKIDDEDHIETEVPQDEE